MSASTLRAYDLSADRALNPVSFGRPPSRLHWRVAGRGGPISTVEVQAAETLLSLLQGGPLVWSTRSTQSHSWIDWPQAIVLRSRSAIHWRIRLIGRDGIVGDWSEPSVFELALLDPEDWHGRWITHPAWVPDAPPAGRLPRLSVTVGLDDIPIRARLYVSGLGVAESFINGVRVGGAYLEPGYADYSMRTPASAWDVTSLLKAGSNTLVAQLGTGIASVSRHEGRYTKLELDGPLPRYIAQLEWIDAKGRQHVEATGDHWRAELSDHAVAHWYGGEDLIIDATSPRPMPVKAAVLGEVQHHAPIWWRTTAPIRVTERVSAKRVVRNGENRRLVDFGTNVAGQLRGHFEHLTPGKRVEFWPAELLDSAGEDVDQTSTGTPIFDTLTSSAEAATFEPSLTYHGFRYVSVRGLAEQETDDCLSVDVLRADLPRVGFTDTSDPYINQLHTVIDRAVQGNMFSVFTDCPHREKLGWNEQLYILFDVLARSYDVHAHLRHQLSALRDAQLPTGMIPSISPEFINFAGDDWRGDPNAFRDDPNWGGAIVFVPWRLYEHYADEAVLAENWSAASRYVEYLHTRAKNGILDHGLGDWIAIDTSTPRALVSTYGYIRILQTMAKTARRLGRHSAALRYDDYSAKALHSFAYEFGQDGGRRWGSGSQASFALALNLGAMDDDSRPGAFAGLVESIALSKGQVTVGENALPALLSVLTAGGRADLVDAMMREPSGPGYAHQLASGATALTESWQGPQGPSAQGSQNHFMLGIIDDWITGSLCGLRQQKGSIGWQRVDIAPHPVDRVDWASTSFEAPSGDMRVRWDRVDDGIAVTAILPPGVTGRVRLASEQHHISEGEHTIHFPAHRL